MAENVYNSMGTVSYVHSFSEYIWQWGQQGVNLAASWYCTWMSAFCTCEILIIYKLKN